MFRLKGGRAQGGKRDSWTFEGDRGCGERDKVKVEVRYIQGYPRLNLIPWSGHAFPVGSASSQTVHARSP